MFLIKSAFVGKQKSFVLIKMHGKTTIKIKPVVIKVTEFIKETLVSFRV